MVRDIDVSPHLRRLFQWCLVLQLITRMLLVDWDLRGPTRYPQVGDQARSLHVASKSVPLPLPLEDQYRV